MAQYDLILTQNVHATLTEFSEKIVNFSKGGLLSADTNRLPAVLVGGTNGYHLVRDDAEVTGLKWVVQPTLPTLSSLGAQSTANLSVNVTTDGASDTKYPSVKAVKDYSDGLLAAADAMIFKGTVGTGGTYEIAAFNALTTYNAGWTYKIITAGTVKAKPVEIGDMIVATIDKAGSGTLDADWIVLQTNIDGAVTGPASAVSGAVAVFSGTSGKILSSGVTLGTAATTASTDYATSAQGTLATNAVRAVIAGTANGTIKVTTGGGAATDITVTGLGSAAYTASTAYATAAQGTLATNAIPKSTFIGHSEMLVSGTGGVPFGVGIGAYAVTGRTSNGEGVDEIPVSSNTLLGRAGTGNVTGLSGSDVSKIFLVTAPATNTAAGTLGMIAYDANYNYYCTQTGIAGAAKWTRVAMATNW